MRRGRRRGGRGEEEVGGGRESESGHNVPKTLVVHLPLVNKVGQERESMRHNGREEREDQVAQSTQQS